MKKWIVIPLVFLLFLVFSCNRTPKQNTLRIGYTDFSFDQAIVFVLKGILDQQPNLIVELYRVPETTLFSALAEGELDIGLSGWLPHTHQSFLDMHPYEIRVHSMITDSLGLYMVVPEYANLNSINDLRDLSNLFRNTILIPENQNAIYPLGSNVITDYGLDDYNLQEASWDNIISYVDDSVRNNLNFAFISIRPHHSFRRFNLRTLDDPRRSLGVYEQAFLLTNSNFHERMPLIADFLSQVRFTLNDVEQLMEMNQVLGSEPYENALRWINQNTRMINRWLLGD
ncbi:MAG: hypothetical protein FWG98_04295 [Candidatus Cloacimonetes bacterium]|nr:hypothetical protein [Candidatus Cloacimonadota bacterium]